MLQILEYCSIYTREVKYKSYILLIISSVGQGSLTGNRNLSSYFGQKKMSTDPGCACRSKAPRPTPKTGLPRSPNIEVLTPGVSSTGNHLSRAWGRGTERPGALKACRTAAAERGISHSTSLALLRLHPRPTHGLLIGGA